MSIKFSEIADYPAPVRLGIFTIALLVIWLPLAAPIYWLLGSDRNLVTILTMGLMFVEFLFLLRFWGKKVYDRPQIYKHYGLVWTRQNGIDFLKGLSIGLWFCLGLFILEGLLGWLEWTTPTVALFLVIAEGLLSALGIALAEELLFRGWILDELERDYQPQTVLWVNAILFASCHFIKPIEEIIRTFPTFPALILLGLSLVWAKRGHKNRLGICIGLHAGLVWGYYIVNVGKLVQNTEKISPLITGIDSNPIAGVTGLLFLGILAFWMRTKTIEPPAV